jgi:hypothetical protein
MKTMTKIIAGAFAAAAIFIGTNVKAQTTPLNKFRFGVGVEGLLPTGRLHDYSNVGLGGTARLQYGVTNNIALTLTSGYYNYFGKEIPGGADGKYPSFGVVPVKAGAKAFISDGFYFSGEVGAGFATKDEYATSDGGKSTKLILAPGLGYATKSWDIGARYENFSGGNTSNYGTIGLRIAYGFGL